MEGKKRYTVIPDRVHGIPVYVVVDGTNGHWVHVRDCQLWAQKLADQLNKEEAQRAARWLLQKTETGTCWRCEACGAIINDRGEPPARCEACGSHNTLV